MVPPRRSANAKRKTRAILIVGRPRKQALLSQRRGEYGQQTWVDDRAAAPVSSHRTRSRTETAATIASRRSGGPKTERKADNRILWALAAIAIVVLAIEGHRLAHFLPRIEDWIGALGPWGPVLFAGALIVVAPLFLPCTPFGLTAGVVYGLWRGYLLYFASVYAANVLIYLIGGRLLREPVLRALEKRPSLRNTVEVARTRGTSLVSWIRLLPLNPAIFSYAFGAVGVSFRSVAIGSLAMFPHLFLDVYLGTVAAHVTKMAGEGHAHWEREGVLLVAGLALVLVVSWRIARMARAEIESAKGSDFSVTKETTTPERP